jgi:ABC-type transport system substrate-binding protein
MMERSILTGETGLLGIHASTLENTPFVASKYRMENWTTIPALGIQDGCTVTFWLRQDVLWHDLDCAANYGVDIEYFDPNRVDAYDCVANLEFLRENQPPRWSRVWEYLIYSQADGPFKFNVYFDKTSICHASHVSDVALLAPQHIIEVVEGIWETWDPSQHPYVDLGLGPPPIKYPYMTQIVDCGPFVFHHYDRGLAVGQVERFDEFFVSSPVIGSVVGEWRVDPGGVYLYEVLIHNIGAKNWTNKGELTNALVNTTIYDDGVRIFEDHNRNLDPWEHKYLVILNKTIVPCGPHNITVEITGDTFSHTYTHTYVATIREDISTYSGGLIDFTVDMRDIGRAARAFGSYPRHLRWEPPADINDDFVVDMRDIGSVARKFGWQC